MLCGGSIRTRGLTSATPRSCQVYPGFKSESASTRLAVDSTAGLIAVYDGRSIDALYSANMGGHSADSEDVWGNEVAYLRAVPSQTDAEALNSSWGAESYVWEKVIGTQDLARVHAPIRLSRPRDRRHKSRGENGRRPRSRSCDIVDADSRTATPRRDQIGPGHQQHRIRGACGAGTDHHSDFTANHAGSPSLGTEGTSSAGRGDPSPSMRFRRAYGPSTAPYSCEPCSRRQR